MLFTRKAGGANARPKATLNKSPRWRAPWFGMGCKAQTAAIAAAIARMCNAADRPKQGCAAREGLVQRCLKGPRQGGQPDVGNAGTQRGQQHGQRQAGKCPAGRRGRGGLRRSAAYKGNGFQRELLVGHPARGIGMTCSVVFYGPWRKAQHLHLIPAPDAFSQISA